MTLIIAVTNPEGVILTSDSRQTYTNRAGAPRIASDNATKIIQLTDTIAVATSGPAFFADSGKLKSIQAYLEEFRDTALKGAKGKAPKACLEVGQALDSYCQVWLERIVKASISDSVSTEGGTDLKCEPVSQGKIEYEYKDKQGQVVKKDWGLPIPSFVIVGRDSNGSMHAINVTPFFGVGFHSTADQPNIQWSGQTEVLAKLLTGTDPFVISAATMTIQDAIDFAILLTRTTENLQKFSDGTVASQGGIPGVGGPIDVVLIGKKGKLQWLSQKKLHAEESSTDII